METPRYEAPSNGEEGADIDRFIDRAVENLSTDGPPVDRGKLRKYIDGELDEVVADEVGSYVASFRGWHDALGEMLREGTDQ